MSQCRNIVCWLLNDTYLFIYYLLVCFLFIYSFFCCCCLPFNVYICQLQMEIISSKKKIGLKILLQKTIEWFLFFFFKIFLVSFSIYKSVLNGILFYLKKESGATDKSFVCFAIRQNLNTNESEWTTNEKYRGNSNRL